MTAYAFRITCQLAANNFDITEGDISLVLPASASPIHVKVRKSGNWTRGRTLILQGGGFSSEEEARAIGTPVKTAVILAGLLFGVGIDVGVLQLKPDTEGATTLGITFGRPVLKKPISTSDFEKTVAEACAWNKVLTKKQTLAAQLYNQSHFQAARFLTLISAVEALAERRSRSSAAVALIERMMEMSVAAGNPDDLNNGLGNLKQESIGSACRRLVTTYCGKPAATDLMRMYKIRGTLLHEGEPSPGANLAMEAHTLDRLVRHLVLKHVADN
jgi:hypothetical protein